MVVKNIYIICYLYNIYYREPNKVISSKHFNKDVDGLKSNAKN